MNLLCLFALLEPAAPAARPAPAGADEEHVRALVRRAVDRDEAAATELYEHMAPRVFRTVRALCRDDAEAEDIVQETFVRAFDALARYEPRDDARFGSWLLAIATNVFRKRARRARRLRVVDPGSLTRVVDAAETSPGPDAALERGRTRAALLAALAELTERERLLLALRYGGELDAPAIARLVDMSPANVRKSCERLRTRLLARLQSAEARSLDDGGMQ